ncbi:MULTISPECIES: hydrolase [unclassified Bradyrhizobium]|uniref:hydrolase n=1 Tax=unclassified Bradyrhizobium TaxID=2631580 RepID=UPI00247A84F2|nr:MULTISPECIES: hydrolase [unclassified Bradyrhizobium]WGS18069.1 hydrolase [Bradyrhizobium sp. ISRA463]WGS24881.1 hydrolase [Bradyrhizobium sp. ISRA464]
MFCHLGRHIRTAAAGIATLLSLAGSAHAQSPRPVYDQLTPDNSVLLLIDFQPQYTFSTRSLPIDTIVNNAEALAKAARVFKVPTVVTTITAKAFAGPLLADLQAVNPDVSPIDRTVINAWSDPRVRDAVKATGRKKIIMAGLWTDNCIMLPALAALKEGYEVYVVADASGDYDQMSQQQAMARLVQAGAVPTTWLPVMLEWQADWSNSATSGAVNQIMREHAKAIAAGSQYLRAMK